MPYISVILPVYNAEKYISQAIDSVLAQTFSNFEVIVVDDCSTDKTVNIILGYVRQYKCVKILRRTINSGGCRIPRFDGVMAAKGEYVCCIDADDFIESVYLQKLVNRQKETNASIVAGIMLFANEQGKLYSNGMQIPSKKWDMSIVQDGKTACRRTIGKGDWGIAMAGALIQSDLYKDYINENYSKDINCFFIDELDHRRLLYRMPVVSMTDAKYYYRQQPCSISHTVSIKSYDIMSSDLILYEFVKSSFAYDKSALTSNAEKYMDDLYRCYIKYFSNYKRYNKEQKKTIRLILDKSMCFLKSNNMHFSSPKYKLISSCKLMMKLIAIVAILYTKIKKYKNGNQTS